MLALVFSYIIEEYLIRNSSDVAGFFMIALFAFYPYLLAKGALSVLGHFQFHRIYQRIPHFITIYKKTIVIFHLIIPLITLSKYSVFIAFVIKFRHFSEYPYLSSRLFLTFVILSLITNAFAIAGLFVLRKSQKKLKNEVERSQIFPILYPLGYMIRTIGSIITIYALFDLFEPKPIYDGATNYLQLPGFLEYHPYEPLNFALLLGFFVILYIIGTLMLIIGIRKTRKSLS